MLLEAAANLNEEQRQFAGELKRHAVRFLSLYDEYLPHFAELTFDTRILAFDLRNPLGFIEGYCELLLTRETDNLSQSRLQLLQQIKAAHEIIYEAFVKWVNSEYLKPQ